MFVILHSRRLPSVYSSSIPLLLVAETFSQDLLDSSCLSRDVVSTRIKKAVSLLLVLYSWAKVLYIRSLVSPQRCISLSFCPSS